MSTQRDQPGAAGAPEASEPGAGWVAPDTARTTPHRPAAPRPGSPGGTPPPPDAADFTRLRPPAVPNPEWVTEAPAANLWDTLSGTSGLPSSRPTYREPHPVRLPAVAAGAVVTGVWYLLAGLLSWSVRSYAWITILAGLLAWLAALALARFGDRGVAAGVAGVSGAALGVMGLVVGMALVDGDWILW